MKMTESEIGMIQLIEKDGKLGNAKKNISNGDVIVIGSGNNAQVKLKGRNQLPVLPEHCKITCENGIIYLEKKFGFSFFC